MPTLPPPMRRSVLPALAALLLIAAAVPASAQPPDPSRRLPLPEAADTTDAARFRAADAALRAGQVGEATAVLQALYLSRPDVPAYRIKLVEAYRQGARYGSGVSVLTRHLAATPDDAAAGAERAALRLLDGDSTAAMAEWTQIAGDGRDAVRLRLVVDAMDGAGRADDALALLDRVAARGSNAAPLGDVRQRLLVAAGRIDEAADAYLGLVADDPRQATLARDRLAPLVDVEGALPGLVAAAARRARRHPTNRPLREIYAWLALENGDAARALDEARAVDRFDRQEGRVLLTFARTATEAGAYPSAEGAYDDVLRRYADAPTAADARLGLGLLHERWADAARERTFSDSTHGARALAALRAFVAVAPGHPDVPDARARIGRILLDIAGQPGAAVAAADAAALTRGRALVASGDLDAATRAFAAIDETLRTGDVADRARYELALLDLYRGNLDAATDRADVLAEDASADVANDAIELKLLLVENRRDSLDVGLARYTRAALLVRQQRLGEALDSLGVLINDLGARQAPLLDDARMLRADALREAGRAAEAAGALREVAEQHPDSYVADRALSDLADVEAYALARPLDGAATLDRLAERYPGSLLLPDARRRQRQWRPAPAVPPVN